MVAFAVWREARSAHPLLSGGTQFRWTLPATPVPFPRPYACRDAAPSRGWFSQDARKSTAHGSRTRHGDRVPEPDVGASASIGTVNPPHGSEPGNHRRGARGAGRTRLGR